METDIPQPMSVDDQIKKFGITGKNAEVFRNLSAHDREGFLGLFLGQIVVVEGTKDVAGGLIDPNSGKSVINIQD